MPHHRYIIVLLVLISHLNCISQSIRIKGTVFLDTNNNGIFDNNEKGVAGIGVSNGREVVQTDIHGGWELPVKDESGLFVIKPANYSVPVNPEMIPQH
jgi:hypothetical protein